MLFLSHCFPPLVPILGGPPPFSIVDVRNVLVKKSFLKLEFKYIMLIFKCCGENLKNLIIIVYDM